MGQACTLGGFGTTGEEGGPLREVQDDEMLLKAGPGKRHRGLSEARTFFGVESIENKRLLSFKRFVVSLPSHVLRSTRYTMSQTTCR